MHTSEVIVDGDVVVKLHRPGTDPRALATRLRVAAGLECLLPPESTEPERVGDRWCTRWSRVETVPPDPQRAPWADAARLLARLHVSPCDLALPHGGPDRLRRALDALGDGPAARTIRRAAARLPDDLWTYGPQKLVHGDWHLGQMGRLGNEWLLIDIDDLGVGDPAWDLARPAGFWAAGLLPDADWATFVDAYRAADGMALRAAPEDPWPVLDPFARAAVIAAAARAVDDEAGELLVEACARML